MIDKITLALTVFCIGGLSWAIHHIYKNKDRF